MPHYLNVGMVLGDNLSALAAAEALVSRTPQEMMHRKASSTDMSRGMTFDRSNMMRYPDVGFGVVGTKIGTRCGATEMSRVTRPMLRHSLLGNGTRTTCLKALLSVVRMVWMSSCEVL